MSFPKFGAAGSVERDEDSKVMEELEFRDGFETAVFDLKHTQTLTRSAPSSYALTYGIKGSADNPIGCTLVTASLEKTEEATDPHTVACAPGSCPGSSDLLTYTDGLIIFRVAEVLTIEGFVDCVSGCPFSRGEYLHLGSAAGAGIKPAVGSATVEIYGDDFMCRRADTVRESTEWEKFTCEFIKYTGNTAETALENILSLELFGSGDIPAGAFYTIRQTITLNAEDSADMEEAIECFEGSGDCS